MATRQYGVFKKPIYCPNASHTGFDKYAVNVGDIVVYEWSDGTRALGRVVGRALRDGDGNRYKKNVLAVLQTDDAVTHAYLVHVEPALIRRVRAPSKTFAAVFFGAQLLEPNELDSFVKYGAMSEHYVGKYLDDQGNLRADWREHK